MSKELNPPDKYSKPLLAWFESLVREYPEFFKEIEK